MLAPINGVSVKTDNGPWFSPEEVMNLAAALDAALSKLRPVDRTDLRSTMIAKLIIQIAGNGERDPKKLCDGALKILRK